MLRVKPHDPDASLLIVKMELPESVTDGDADYGGHMPQGNASLTAEQMQGIRNWIARGALRDEPEDVSGPGVVP